MFKHLIETTFEGSIILYVVWKFDTIFNNLLEVFFPDKFTEFNDMLIIIKSILGILVTIIVLITAYFKMNKTIKESKTTNGNEQH